MNPIHLLARRASLVLALGLSLALAACGDDPKPAGPTAEAPAQAPAYALDTAPGTATSIVDALTKQEGDEVVLSGRVSSLEKGFAAFTLTDDSVPYCGRDEVCGCPTPWDYCCEVESAKAGRMPVEMRDAEGEPVATPSTGLRLLDLVIVKGTLAKTESGGMMLVIKDGWFRQERPELPADVQWPE